MRLSPESLIVTGAAGFIGAHVARILNCRQAGAVVAVDDLTDGRKYRNLVDVDLADYIDKDRFYAHLDDHAIPAGSVRAVFHLGACTDTTEWDGRRMMADNYTASVALYDWCQRHGIPFVYASSAEVYGVNDRFTEDPANEAPLNVYGYSKCLFDRYVRHYAHQASAQVVGLRYFNVYGPGETHKGRMASVMYHFAGQLARDGVVRLFEGSGGFGAGEQRRDFVHVEDVACVTTWFLDHPEVSGIFNVGTGEARSFNDVARAMISWAGEGRVEYVPFPTDLLAAYQHFTEADLTLLRRTGCDVPMRSIDEGVPAYLDWLRD